MERFSVFVVKGRWLIILFVFAVTVFLGFQISKIRINSDVISSLPADDKDAVLLKRIGEQFGGNRLGMVIVDGENIYTTVVLQQIKQITDSLTQIQGISSVTSLTNTTVINESEDGIEIGPLVDESDFPDSSEELDHLRERVMANDLLKGSIVSEDGTAALVIFTLYDDADIQTIAAAVKEKSEAIDFSGKIYYAGSPMLITSISTLISADMALLFPIALLVIALVLFISFRSFKGVFMPLLVCIIAVVWVIGIMGLGGFEMSMVSNNIPIVLLAVFR